MTPAPSSSTTVDRAQPRVADRAGGGSRSASSPAAVLVLVLGLAATAAVVTDAVSGGADLGLVSLALLSSAVAVTLRQALRGRAGRPERTTRRAAATGSAAALFVAAFLSCVGVLERLGPEVTSSAAFAVGVAAMSVVLLVVLPLALVVFSWAVSRDRRLRWWTRVLPWAFVAVGAVAVAVTAGGQVVWLQAAAVAMAGAALTGVTAGLSRAAAGRASGPARRTQDRERALRAAAR
jgi:membrane protein implicated in regulation of membrane protease activity